MKSTQRSNSVEQSHRAQSLHVGDYRKDSGAENEMMKDKENFTEVSD